MRKLIALMLVLSGCGAAPRSANYFETHPEEARRVVVACRSGEIGGRECETASAGLAALQAERRQDLFKKSFE